MIYKLNKPDIDTIVDYCDNLKANEKLEIYEFGQNKDLVLHIYKDEDYSNIVTISTFQDGICIDDTVTDGCLYKELIATVYKGNIIKNLIMDCQSYTKYRPNETTGGIFVSWRRKEELPTGA